MSKPTQPATSLSADIQAAGHLQAQVDAQVQASVDTPMPAAEHTHEVKPLNPLTHKQKKFVELIVDDNLSKTEAYIQAYDHEGIRKTAHEEASRTARIPQVKLELDKYSAKAESTVLEVMELSKEYAHKGNTAGASYANTALQAANSILDRVHGKATQRVETQTRAVVLNIDLTGVVTPDSGDTQEKIKPESESVPPRA
jgi:hypothetical protein